MRTTGRRLVLVGGGHAHLFVLEAFVKSPLPGAELMLVTPTRLAPYSGMMPGVIAGHYRYEDGCVDLQPLCDAAGCILHQGRTVSVDTARRRVVCSNGQAFAYDVLSIDTGSVPGAGEIDSVARYAHPVKPIDRFVADVEAFCARHEPDRPARIVVVGAGAAGCEVVLALQYRFSHLPATLRGGTGEFTLIGDTPLPLSGLSPGAGRRMAQLLHRRGVRLLLRNRVAAIGPDTVTLADGTIVAADFVAWATGSSAPAWPQEAGLSCDRDGYIRVDSYLRSTSHASVFATGDIATMAGHPRPKSGVYAVRAGPPLARNLRAALAGEPLLGHAPQKWALALVSAGVKYAIGAWGPLSWEGAWVWNWKDRIDRRFVDRFNVAGALRATSKGAHDRSTAGSIR